VEIAKFLPSSMDWENANLVVETHVSFVGAFEYSWVYVSYCTKTAGIVLPHLLLIVPFCMAGNLLSSRGSLYQGHVNRYPTPLVTPTVKSMVRNRDWLLVKN
jgi:hypothetical protein